METSTNPIQTLQSHAANLEAAITVSLADPTRKAVHSLRSEMRRIEAQLDLLKPLRGLPPYKPAADKLLKRLGKLRHLAGDVRDCDVQRKLLKDSHGELRSPYEEPQELEKEKDQLQKTLRQRRRRKEHRLLHSLERQRSKLTHDLESVLEALKPVESMDVCAEELRTHIERTFLRAASFRQGSEERLHNVRKAAKRARYQCEALPGEAAAALAAQLEEMQDAGGMWHDLLILAEHSVEELGADHPLSRVLERSRDERLEGYVERLNAFRRARRTSVQAETRARRQEAAGRSPSTKAQRPASSWGQKDQQAGAAKVVRKGVRSAEPAASLARKMAA